MNDLEYRLKETSRVINRNKVSIIDIISHYKHHLATHWNEETVDIIIDDLYKKGFSMACNYWYYFLNVLQAIDNNFYNLFVRRYNIDKAQIHRIGSRFNIALYLETEMVTFIKNNLSVLDDEFMINSAQGIFQRYIDCDLL